MVTPGAAPEPDTTNTRVYGLAIVAALMMFCSAGAQDPGGRDSIIIDNAFFSTSAESVYVAVYAVTDDPVAFYNLPLRFTSDGGGIVFSHVSYLLPILDWDENSHDFIDEYGYLRMFGIFDTGGEDNDPLNTENLRFHLWNIVFDVGPDASDQTILIEAATDEINGPATFGTTDGITEFYPAFRAGSVTFGNPMEVPALSEWGLIVLALTIMAAATAVAIGSRRFALGDRH